MATLARSLDAGAGRPAKSAMTLPAMSAPPRTTLDGSWRGRADVLEATRRNFGTLSGQQPGIDAMISQGESVAVLLRESGVFKSTGQAYSVRGVQWFTFAGGKIFLVTAHAPVHGLVIPRPSGKPATP